MYTLKVKGILNECIYHPSQSQAARRPDGPRPIFMLLPALPSSVSLAIGGFCCAPVSQGRGPSGWPGPSDVYLDDRRTLATGEVWACFCVFSIMLHSSGLIGEPRDAGAFATHPHTKKPRRRRSRFKRGEGRWGSFAHLRMGMFYLKKRKATALATTTQADVDNKRQKNSHKTRTEKKAARHRHRA